MLIEPQTINFSCPGCSGKLSVPASLAGVSGPCPYCSQSICAPAVSEEPASQSPFTPSPASTSAASSLPDSTGAPAQQPLNSPQIPPVEGNPPSHTIPPTGLPERPAAQHALDGSVPTPNQQATTNRNSSHQGGYDEPPTDIGTRPELPHSNGLHEPLGDRSDTPRANRGKTNGNGISLPTNPTVPALENPITNGDIPNQRSDLQSLPTLSESESDTSQSAPAFPFPTTPPSSVDGKSQGFSLPQERQQGPALNRPDEPAAIPPIGSSDKRKKKKPGIKGLILALLGLLLLLALGIAAFFFFMSKIKGASDKPTTNEPISTQEEAATPIQPETTPTPPSASEPAAPQASQFEVPPPALTKTLEAKHSDNIAAPAPLEEAISPPPQSSAVPVAIPVATVDNHNENKMVDTNSLEADAAVQAGPGWVSPEEENVTQPTDVGSPSPASTAEEAPQLAPETPTPTEIPQAKSAAGPAAAPNPAPVALRSATPSPNNSLTPTPTAKNTLSTIKPVARDGQTMPVDAQPAFDSLIQFLSAGSVGERLSHSVPEEGLQAQMEAHYSKYSPAPINPTQIIFNAFTDQPDTNSKFAIFLVVSEESPLGFPVYLQSSGDSFKVAWKAFAEFKDNLLSDFMNTPQSGTQTFHVIMRRHHYLKTDIADADSKLCFLIEPPLPDQKFHAFVEEDSDLGRSLAQQIKWGYQAFPIAELEWVEPGAGAPFVQIKNIPRLGWGN